jgi:TM2 domain-containing membrane protein YozV
MKAVAILINFFFPGIGTMMVGKVGEGMVQFLLGFLLVIPLLIIPVIGWGLAVFLGLGVRCWAILSAATAKPKDSL